MTTVDLNCDLGEGAGTDAELMPLISSANVACGAHAGGLAEMRDAATLAARHGVGLGAHPGYEDRENFGRVPMRLPRERLTQLVVSQVEALRKFGPVRHVKPHGALYNQAATDPGIAEIVARAVSQLDSRLILFAPAGSELARAGRVAGLRVAQEVFADRTYQSDGTLTPRTDARGLIAEVDAMLAQVLSMLRTGCVRSIEGREVPIVADTLCLHGDGPKAVAFARRLRQELAAAHIEVRTVFER